MRRVIVCEACGGSVSYYDEQCSSCHSYLEPLEGMRHRLPSSKMCENAEGDAELIKPLVDRLGNFGWHWKPIHVDKLTDALEVLRDRKYSYREYILDLMSLVARFRSICMDSCEERRETHLEIFKRLEAIYNSLTN